MRAILTWHSIDGSGSPISVSAREFDAQLAWLQASHTRVLSLPALLAARPDTDAVALTFDDGFRNFGTDAFPRLEALGWPCTLFVVSGHVGGRNRWGGHPEPGIPDLSLLDWEALGHLQERGVAIGAHTRSHRSLEHLRGEAALRDELEGCAADIHGRLGSRPEGLAYPYGSFTPTVVAAAAEVYAWACTTELRPLGGAEHRLTLPRLDAWYLRHPERLGRWGSRRLRTWLTLRGAGRRLRALARRGAAR